MDPTIAVIGGGASGMMAAITAAKTGARVTIYEKNDRLGKKILATGNGKCNLSNLQMSLSEYQGSDPALIWKCLSRFGVQDTVHFFESLGLMIKEKNGYLYPVSEQAASVLDVLRNTVEQLGIQVIYETTVDQVILTRNRKLEVVTYSGKKVYDKVILACGSKAAPKTGSDGNGYKIADKLGLELVPVVPALVQLKCREEYCKAISGVRTDALIHIWDGKKKLLSERGELQLTDYGISGIPVFQLSGAVNHYRLRYPKAQLRAEINFLPDISEEDWKNFVKERIKKGNKSSEVSVEMFFTGMLNKKLMLLFVKLAGLKTNEPVAKADKEKLEKVFAYCRSFSLSIVGSNSYDNAQICAGGISLKEVNQNLEAKKVPGLYLVGELLDVDGRCGGYNLQWAWSSGWIAGNSAARNNKPGGNG